MKKTIFLFALGFGMMLLTRCSRGYGCPYTMDATIQNKHDERALERTQKNTKTENLEIITKQIEILDAEVIAD